MHVQRQASVWTKIPLAFLTHKREDTYWGKNDQNQREYIFLMRDKYIVVVCAFAIFVLWILHSHKSFLIFFFFFCKRELDHKRVRSKMRRKNDLLYYFYSYCLYAVRKRAVRFDEKPNKRCVCARTYVTILSWTYTVIYGSGYIEETQQLNWKIQMWRELWACTLAPSRAVAHTLPR